MNQKEFIIDIFEEAFGDNARPEEYNSEIPKEDRREPFSYVEVAEKITEYSNHALKWEEQEGLN